MTETETQQEQQLLSVNTTSEEEGNEETEAASKPKSKESQTRETESVSQTQSTTNNVASRATTTTTKAAASSSSPSKKPSFPKYSYRFLMANACRRYNGERSVIGYLMEKKKNDARGWLRRLEASILWESQNGTNNEATPAAAASLPREIDLTKQLTAMEKRRAMDLILLGKPDDRILTLVSYAYGVDPTTLARLERSLLENPDLSLERKPRSDRGRTVWNSDQKRNSLFTPQFVFAKKIRRLQPPPNGKAWTGKQIRRAWKKADPSVKEECARTAQEWKEKGSSMIEQVTQTLDENAATETPHHPNEQEQGAVEATNNSALSAIQLAQQVTPTGIGDGSEEVTMVSRNTVLHWVKTLPDRTATYVHKERGWHYCSKSGGARS